MLHVFLPTGHTSVVLKTILLDQSRCGTWNEMIKATSPVKDRVGTWTQIFKLHSTLEKTGLPGLEMGTDFLWLLESDCDVQIIQWVTGFQIQRQAQSENVWNGLATVMCYKEAVSMWGWHGTLGAHNMSPRHSFGNPGLSQNKTVRRVAETFTPHDIRFCSIKFYIWVKLKHDWQK